MNRRTFMATATCAVAAWPHKVRAQDTKNLLSIRSSSHGHTLPKSFTGLSYELAQLSEPEFFSPEHRELVAIFRTLSPSGILRIGGNSSEFCWFQATAQTLPPKLHIPAGNLAQNWMPHRLFAIQPSAINALAGFLKATGWTAIYGLNFGNSSQERAAIEAEYVHHALGDRLEFFQIGNEPDFYKDASNGTRPAGWGFDDYVHEWMAYADAISKKLPMVRFGGPDTGASSDWVTRFGESVAPKLGKRLVALSGHYYAEGPPNDPRVTTERLLAGNPKVSESTREIMKVADSHGLTYHMSEGNSCYRGGKPGMSNAYAASLWAADYLLTLASLGCGGVNLHGGTSRYISASLGDHNPGAEVEGIKKQAASNAFYSPIATEPGQPVEARPVYYGMLMAEQFAGATMLSTDGELPPLLKAYAAEKSGRLIVALINKDSLNNQELTLISDTPKRKAKAWWLNGSALEATDGITFGGASVGLNGQWSPKAESLVINGGRLNLQVPAAGGVLIFLD